jgi:CheY-specific phosphatase CheX
MNSVRGALGKHVLLVERIGGPLSHLVPTIEELGYRVLRASDAQAIAGMLRSLRRLSLVIINGDNLKTQGAELLASIKQQHAEAAVLWFTNDAKTIAAPVAGFAVATGDIRELETRVVELALEDFYSASFTQPCIAGIQEVLKALALPHRPPQCSLKSGLTELDELNALIVFGAGKIAGHLIVSASLAEVTAAHRVQFPRRKAASPEDLEDLLGEAANQILGQIKRFADSDDEDYRLGLPQFMRGSGASFRHKTGVPALNIEFNSGSERLRVQLVMSRFDGTGIRLQPLAQSQLVPGAVNFL